MERFASIYINRAKTIISRASSIGLIFLFTLTYVWYKSVLPNKEFISKLVTVKEKSVYFDSVYYNLKASDSVGLSKLYRKKLDTIKSRIGREHISFNSNKILIYDTTFQKTLSKRKNKFNEAIVPIKRITDSIKGKLKDSLNAAQFEIQVPTLSSVKTDYNVGFPIWMALA